MSNVNKINGNNISIELGTIIVEGKEETRGACWQHNMDIQFPIIGIVQENGAATVDVGSPHEGYSIQTVLKNGKPNGESRILDRDNMRVASLTFVNGVASGPCKLYDDEGNLFFEGSFTNGYREGEGKEFDEDGNIIYEGLFKEGKRMNVTRMHEMEGYWKEENEKNEIISICRKNNESLNDGICYFYSNGMIEKVCEWKNGVELNVMKRFEGNKMIEFEDGVKRYEGEYRDSVVDGYPREGKGKEYNEDGKTILYRGSFLNGRRHGNGIEYSNGEIIFKGNWNKGERLENEGENERKEGRLEERVDKVTVNKSSDLSVISVNVTHLIIASNCNDISSLNFNVYEGLQSIEVGDECFESVDAFRIDGLNHLKSIKIGMNSFTKKKNNHGNNSSRSFHILNCNRLESFEIGEYSFSDYSGQFELKNLPSLSKIKIGEIGSWSFNFFYSSFVVKDIPNLQSIQLGYDAFAFSLSTVISNLPNLKSIQLGYGALFGRGGDSCSLEMKDLPKLEEIINFDETGRSFKYPRSVILSNIPNLKTVKLPNSFQEVKTKSISNVSWKLSHLVSSPTATPTPAPVSLPKPVTATAPVSSPTATATAPIQDDCCCTSF